MGGEFGPAVAWIGPKSEILPKPQFEPGTQSPTREVGASAINYLGRYHSLKSPKKESY